MIYIGKRMMTKPYLGAKNVKRVYLGTTVVWSDVVRIYYTLSGVTCNGVAQVDGGASFSATLTGSSGKQVDPLSVVVMMGTTDITDTAYDWTTNAISIASVTDTVTITAVGITMDGAYKPVKYLESPTTASTSNGYFETGYYPTNLTEVEADIYITSLTNYSGVFGCNTNTAPYFAIMARYSGNYGRAWWGNNELTSSNFGAYIKIDTRQTVKMGKGTFTCIQNGNSNYTTVTFASTTTTPWTAANALSFGGYKAGSSTYRGAKLKLYRFTIKEDGTTIRYYVPCYRVSDSVNGFYDTVNGTFLTQPNGGSDWTLPT